MIVRRSPRAVIVRPGVPPIIVTAPAAPIGGGGGVTDHSALTGLADDDHTQYALADGSRGAFATTAQGALADSALQPPTHIDFVFYGPGTIELTDVEANWFDGGEPGFLSAIGLTFADQIGNPVTSGGNPATAGIYEWDGANLVLLDPQPYGPVFLNVAVRTDYASGEYGLYGEYSALTVEVVRPSAFALGLGGAALLDVGTTDGTVAAGDAAPNAHGSSHGYTGSDPASGLRSSQMPHIETVVESGTTRTMSDSDSGKLILCTNAGGCTVTFPDTMTGGVGWLQQDDGAGPIEWAATGDMVILPAGDVRAAHTESGGEGSTVTWAIYEADLTIIGGDTA